MQINITLRPCITQSEQYYIVSQKWISNNAGEDAGNEEQWFPDGGSVN